MKILNVCLLLLIGLVTLTSLVSASHEGQNDSGLILQELPEIDMTGLHTDIELIEIDPEITNATKDWILLAHDDAGKKGLIEDIDSSDLIDAEKTDTKKAVKELWETYPTKFESVGEKSIEIVVQSERSSRTVSVPVGHVTRISFDREKIKQVAKEQKNTRLLNIARADPDEAAIVLSDIDNETVKNITGIREKKIKSYQQTNRNPSSGKSSSPQYTGSSQHSVLSSSSESGSGSDFSSPSFGDQNLGNSLKAWAGAPEPTESPTMYHSNSTLYNGHNSFVYFAASHLNYQYATTAADHALDPDGWAVDDNCQIYGIPLTPKNMFKGILHSFDHYYNPDNEYGCAYSETQHYADLAKENFSSGNYGESAKYLGISSHFFTDVSNPMHTGQEINQAWDKLLTSYDTHAAYENYVYQNWSSNTSIFKFGTLVQNNNYYYKASSPETATKNMAIFSHAYLDTLYYKIKNQPGKAFYSDNTVKLITENCILVAARYTGGLVDYTTSQNSVTEKPLADFIASKTSGFAPLEVQFTDKSHYTTAYTTWSWEFGDGEVATDRAIYQHTYQNSGTYTAKLTVTNPAGSSIKTMNIEVGGIPPDADFSSKTVGPSTIQFTDSSNYGPTSWSWDFGDGSDVSVEQNPSHHYNGGFFPTVILYVSNRYGSDAVSKQVLVNNPWPVANFVVDKQSGPAPLKVQFTDNSTNYPNNWTWNFGDNSSLSYQRNTSHTYNNSGKYTVQLKASNDYGNSIQTTVITITPLADFTANHTLGQAPFAVAFTDNSTGNPTKWNWSFGDNSTSSERNPVHVYNTDGSFTVSLNATSPGGSNISTKTGYICTDCIRPIPPVADFTVNVTSGTLPLTVAFFGKTVGGPTNTWLWNFGDGQNSTLQNPVHKYNAKGNYSISLTIKNTAGTSTRVLPNWIRAGFDIITVNNTQNNSTISIAQNNIIRLELNQCTSCGYEWSLNITPGLNVINTSFIKNPSLPGIDGGSGQNVWDITAVSIGEQNITAFYKRPGIPLTGNELTFRLNITVSLPIIPLPGYSVMPTDPDSDGLYEDLNGNGRLDFADGVLYFNQMTWISANEPIAAFDLNGNGRIDFADIVVLFNEI